LSLARVETLLNRRCQVAAQGCIVGRALTNTIITLRLLGLQSPPARCIHRCISICSAFVEHSCLTSYRKSMNEPTNVCIQHAAPVLSYACNCLGLWDLWQVHSCLHIHTQLLPCEQYRCFETTRGHWNQQTLVAGGAIYAMGWTKSVQICLVAGTAFGWTAAGSS
jgi:hypothetical protein